MKQLRGVLVLGLCLLVAGLIWAVTPKSMPEYRPVRPDSDGVARADMLDAQLLDAQLTTKVSAGGVEYESLETFVVITYWAQARGDTRIISPTLRTTGGLTYEPISRSMLLSFTSVQVGQAVTSMIVFEVPPDLIPGAKFVVGAHISNGVQPVAARPTFDLPDPMPTASEAIVILPDETTAGR